MEIGNGLTFIGTSGTTTDTKSLGVTNQWQNNEHCELHHGRKTNDGFQQNQHNQKLDKQDIKPFVFENQPDNHPNWFYLILQKVQSQDYFIGNPETILEPFL